MKKKFSFQYFYRTAIGIFFCVLSLGSIIELLATDSIPKKLYVKAKTDVIATKQTLRRYENAIIEQDKTALIIKQPTLLQKVFWPQNDGYDFLLDVVIVICSIAYLVIASRLDSKSNPFAVDVRTPLQIIAASVILLGLFGHIRKHYINHQIELITDNQFSYDLYGSDNSSFLTWIGFLLCLIASWYTKAYKLQQEQDLTI